MALLDFVRNNPVSWHREGKTNLDLLEQEIVSGSGICWDMKTCTLTQTQPCQHPTIGTSLIPPLSFLQAGCSSCCPTNSFKALKANVPNKF